MLCALVLGCVASIVSDIQGHKTLGALQCAFLSVSVAIVLHHRIYDTHTENCMVFVSHSLCAAAFASAGEKIKHAQTQHHVQ
jgi:hypothetical protein